MDAEFAAVANFYEEHDYELDEGEVRYKLKRDGKCEDEQIENDEDLVIDFPASWSCIILIWSMEISNYS